MNNHSDASEAEKGPPGRYMACRPVLTAAGVMLNGNRYYDWETISALLSVFVPRRRVGSRPANNLDILIGVISKEPLVLDSSEIFVRNPRSGNWFRLPNQFPDWGKLS
ncbi:hypothetical protein AMC78_CH02539 [Rhizobium phaseoli]|nr:hypothetical protein AMC78_CH02539 [Rhizobium phaseoli]